MTTPNITAGVTELTKPRTFRPTVCWRAETTLANGASIASPVFDCTGDGFPFTEVEAAGFAVVRVASPVFHVICRVDSNNMKLQIFQIQDNGVQNARRTLYVPNIPNTEVKGYRFTTPGRRCQFRLLNTPLGQTAGVNTTVRIEVVNEA